MPYTKQQIARRRQGFTLLEVLLALGIGSFVLLSAMYYVVSLGSIWVNRTTNDFFRQHADGVTLFLHNGFALSQPVAAGKAVENDASEEAVEEAEAAIPAEQGGEAQANVPMKDPVSWERPPGYDSFDKPLLTFHLREPPALLADTGPRMTALTCHLFFQRREGLSLLWYSQLEEVEDLQDVRHTLISRYVTEIAYAYYDFEDDRWETEREPKDNDEGQFVLPDALKLTFEYDEDKIETVVYLPRKGKNIPLY